MAACRALNLLCKTYHCSLKAAYDSNRIRSLSTGGCTLKHLIKKNMVEKQRRSYSQPSTPRGQLCKPPKENFFRVRNISRSSDNLRAKYKDEVTESHGHERSYGSAFRFQRHETAEQEDETQPQIRKKTPQEVDVYDDEEKEEIVFHESSVRYEVTGSSKTGENFFNVYDYMSNKEHEKPKKLFPHLQPNNMKPFGAHDNLFFPDKHKLRPKIVYPIITSTDSSFERNTHHKVAKIQHTQFSSFKGKEYPGLEDIKKVTVCENKSKTQNNVQKKNYSTACMKASAKVKPPVLLVKSSDKLASQIAKGVLRKSKPKSELQTVTRYSKITEILLRHAAREVPQFQQVAVNASKLKSSQDHSNEVIAETMAAARKSLSAQTSDKKVAIIPTKSTTTTKKPTMKSMLLNNQKQNVAQHIRKYTTISTEEVNPRYVTVKLSELQEECRKAMKCKPKKQKTNRLPKFIPMDCPCVEDEPLKEGKPLIRLKPRVKYSDPERYCPIEVCPPRADDGLEIKKKTLPKIETAECPCIQSEMTDFVIKRLPKKKVPEPPRICPECIGDECCPPRADEGLKVSPKKLPVHKAPDCPCYEPPKMTEVILKRLVPKPVKEPPKQICDFDPCDDVVRADDGLKIEQKVLPILEPADCPCFEPSPPTDFKIKRLKKVVYKEPPREICEIPECIDPRMDDGLELKRKKLPVYVPQNCPCKEEDPLVDVPLKRLIPKPVPDPIRAPCEPDPCPPRADDGLKVKPKKLPEIIPGDCPCIIEEMADVPLKRLVPKPVEEPVRPICHFDPCEDAIRADDGLKVEMKKLPPVPKGNCPCPPPKPLKDCAPLKRLKKIDILEPEKVCVLHDPCIQPRADDNLKVKSKVLPKLELNNCPCVDPEPMDPGKPLPRLRKAHVPEPPRICSVEDICDETTRADEQDWMYWMQIEEKKALVYDSQPKSGVPSKTSKRDYSTSAKRNYEINYYKKSPMCRLEALAKQTGDEIATFLGEFKMTPDVVDLCPESCSPKCQEVLFSKSGKSTDYVGFIVYRGKSDNSNLKSKDIENTVGHIARFISTYKQMFKKREEDYLQPRKPIIKELEKFIMPYPEDQVIETARYKSRKFDNKPKLKKIEETPPESLDTLCTVKDDIEKLEKLHDIDKVDIERIKEICPPPPPQLSLWERIVNYFKARDCPSPEEFRKLRLKEEAEKAAAKAGLCLYDPMEECKKTEMPKVITADKCGSDSSKK